MIKIFLYLFISIAVFLTGCSHPNPRYRTSNIKFTTLKFPKFPKSHNIKTSAVRKDDKQENTCVGNSVLIRINHNGIGNFSICENSKISRTGKVSAGKPDGIHDTPTGEFKITRKIKYWDSKKYPSKDGTRNMDFSSFFYNGYAIHKGSINHLSRGCIHMKEKDAKYIFENFKLGDTIIIEKSQNN